MTHLLRSEQRWVFRLIKVGCVLFVVLTVLAMLFYPDGTVADPTASAYSFFANVLSELGMTETHPGQPNTVSRVLFTTALTLTGAGLAAFFLVFRQFFVGSRTGRVLSRMGSLSGAICGICLVGAAFTPLDVQEQ